MGVSPVCLLVPFTNGPSYPRRTLSGVAWKLPLPFLTSWPVLWAGWLGYGLAGETARADLLGKFLMASVVLFLLVAIAGAWAACRGLNSNART